MEKNCFSSFFQIRWSEVSPGDIFLLHDDGGPYREPFIISGKGTEKEPIIIKAARGESPAIESSVIFTGAENIVFEGITIENHFERGIIIREKSRNITIDNCVVRNNGLGVWIGGAAGMNHRIINNKIYSNETHGIAVNLVNCRPGNETVIARNRVYNNGHHGLEINASYYIVEENEVYNNGLGIFGASGIHTYAKDAEQDAGDYNIIRYNVSRDNKDKGGLDGNGIQLDQWCDYNTVHHNISYNNDGAGICVFDSSNSDIYNNTIFGNTLDSGKSHAIRAEVILASDYVRGVNHVKNVTLTDNIIVACDKSSYAIYVDKLTSQNPLSIGNNIFFHTDAGDFYLWHNESGRNLDRWNNALASGSGDDIYKDPRDKIPLLGAVRNKQ